MSQLIVDFIISLDGYASAEGWPGWWGHESPGYRIQLLEYVPRVIDGPPGGGSVS